MMTLKDLLRTIRPELEVEIQKDDGSPIITAPAGAWGCLDDCLLKMPVDMTGSQTYRNGALGIRLSTSWPAVCVTTIAELEEAMNDNSVKTVVLGADIISDDDTETLLTIESDENKYLDLNGYMLAATNTYAETVTAIKATGSGLFTIYDSEGCGEVFGGKFAKNNYALWVEGSTVVIEGGYFTAGSMGDDPEGSCAVYVSKGAAVIRGGYFNNDSYSVRSDKFMVLKGNVLCYGGVVIDQNPEKFVSSGKRLKGSLRYYDHLYRVVGK